MKKYALLLSILCLITLIYGNYSYNKKIKIKADDLRVSQVIEDEKEPILKRDILNSFKDKESIIYTPIGDSLTAGFYAPKDEDKFTSVLSEMIEKELGIAVKEVGVASYGGLISGGVEAIPTVNEAQPDLVSIEFGTNDCNPQKGVSLEEFERDLNKIIEEVTTDKGKKVEVVLVTTWNQYSLCEPFDDLIKKVGQERELPVADIESIWRDPSTKGPEGVETFKGISDLFHPNKEGMKRIAENIFTTIGGSIVD